MGVLAANITKTAAVSLLEIIIAMINLLTA